jgi:putative heme iron utilization protein
MQTHIDACRALVRSATVATLSTLARDPAGVPFGSLVAIAADDSGRPILLLSKLAEHTQNLLACADASILVADASATDPLASGRVTLIGRCARVPDGDVASCRARFLERQPSAAQYVDFADFAFYRLEPTALRYVGGFGRMSWVDAAAYLAVT